MKRKLIGLASIILVVTTGGGFVLVQRSHRHLIQNLAIPSYFAPGADWTRMIEAAPTVGVVVINPSSGPGTVVDPAYSTQVQVSKAKGLTVLGYVPTEHGQRNESDIRQEIDAYYVWYQVDGIFFDQASTDCAVLPSYERLQTDVKAHGGKTLTVLNPGMMTSECFMSAADIIVTFENTYHVYTTEYRAPNWVKKYDANRFWHLIYDAPTVTEMRDAVNLGKKRRAGWMYVTPDTMPNPWSTLPTAPYWRAELEATK